MRSRLMSKIACCWLLLALLALACPAQESAGFVLSASAVVKMPTDSEVIFQDKGEYVFIVYDALAHKADFEARDVAGRQLLAAQYAAALLGKYARERYAEKQEARVVVCFFPADRAEYDQRKWDSVTIIGRLNIDRANWDPLIELVQSGAGDLAQYTGLCSKVIWAEYAK